MTNLCLSSILPMNIVGIWGRCVPLCVPIGHRGWSLSDHNEHETVRQVKRRAVQCNGESRPPRERRGRGERWRYKPNTSLRGGQTQGQSHTHSY